MFMLFFLCKLKYENIHIPASEAHKGDNALSQCLRTVMDVNIFEPFFLLIRWEKVTDGWEHLAGRQHDQNTSHDAAGLK